MLVNECMPPATTAIFEGADAPPVHTEILSDLTELAASWNQLAAGYPMHHYAWVSACAEAFSTPADLQVLVVGPREQPLAIAPLIKRPGGLPRLEQLGVRTLHEPMDLIYKNPAAAASLLEAIAHLGLPVFLERVPAESPTVAMAKQAWRGRGAVVRRAAPGTPWIALDRRWREPDPPLEAGRRPALPRAPRKHEKNGPA